MPERHRFVSRPLFLQVRDEIAARIAAGNWKPGALLPNETQLATEFGVAQGTMRRALDLLEAERIVARQQGRGTTVIDHDTEEMAIRFSSIFNDQDQRIAGHITDCRAAFEKGNAYERKILGLAQDEKVAKATRVRAYHDHAYMVEDVALVVRRLPQFDLELFRDARLCGIAQRYGIVLSHAKERVSPAMCPAEHLEKLNLDAPTPVLALERITYDNRNNAIELRKGWCHLRDKHYMSITS